MKFYKYCSIVLTLVVFSNVHSQYNNTDYQEHGIYGPYELDELDFEMPEFHDYLDEDFADWELFHGKIFCLFTNRDFKNFLIS